MIIINAKDFLGNGRDSRYSLTFFTRRFYEIKKAVRFEKYKEECQSDPGWKVKTITTLMRNRCKILLPTPGEFLVVDEGMILFKGRLCKFKRFMPNKPTSYGLKLFMIVDHETGILMDFILDVGQYDKQTYRDTGYGATGAVVLDLVQPWNGRWHTVLADNWFTSPKLAIGRAERYKMCFDG